MRKALNGMKPEEPLENILNTVCKDKKQSGIYPYG